MKAVAKSVAAGLGLAALVCGFGAQAASHREAPLITQYPKVDNTDIYVFRSYEAGREGYVVFIANYIPLQDAYGGPNYFQMDPDALYEIHIDNNGDAREDLTFSFRFTNTVRGHVAQHRRQATWRFRWSTPDRSPPAACRRTQCRAVVHGRPDARRQRAPATREPVLPLVGGTAFEKPIDNIGNKSIPDYAELPGDAHPRHQHSRLHAAGGNVPARVRRPAQGRLRRQPRRDLRPGQHPDRARHRLAQRRGQRDAATRTSPRIALEVPISCLTTASDPVIGAWTTASLPARKAEPARHRADSAAAIVQVSRLGMPLVNELVIGLPDKDKFNGSEPKDDGQFADYVTNPTLPALIASLYADAGVQAPSVFPRTDLVAAFLTGVPNVNQAKTVTRVGDDPAQHRASGDAQGNAEQPRRRGVLRRRRAGAEQSGVRSGRVSRTAVAPATMSSTSRCAW